MKYESIPLPLDLEVVRREACNGSHKLREEQSVGRAGGGGGVARGVQWREEQYANLLKMEKWNGDATVLWVVGKWGNNSR